MKNFFYTIIELCHKKSNRSTTEVNDDRGFNIRHNS